MALDYKLIGSRIHNARINKGLTQEVLAEKLDVSIAFLSRVERGTTEINLLDVSEGEILNGSSSASKVYLNSDFSSLLKNCPPEKLKLIYDISKVIINN